MYSSFVIGSRGFFFIFLESCFTTLSQRVHCVHTISQEYVTVSPLSGSGYFSVWSVKSSSDFLIFHISDILLESRAFAAYHWSDMNAIVHNIAKIVMTTISSTNVKPFFDIDTN